MPMADLFVPIAAMAMMAVIVGLITRLFATAMHHKTLRTAMRAKAVPGEDPMSLKPPAAVAPDIIRMASAEYAEHGVLFDFPTGTTQPLVARPS